MKRKLFFWSVLFCFSTQNSNAQQTLQKVTFGTNQTIVELYQIRNGTSNTNVIGAAAWNQDISNLYGEDLIYLESTGIVYDNQSYQNIPLGTFPTEQIGNGTFEIGLTPYTNNRSLKISNWKYNGNTLPGGEFTINVYGTDRDAVEDGNSNVDLLHYKWVIPHTFDNGSALPVGMWIILRAREGTKDTGGSELGGRIGFRWNGTQWVQQTIDPLGDPFDVLQNATLGVNEIANNRVEISIFPNPSKDFVSIKCDKIENFVYQIFDLSGRNISTGKAKIGEKINIQILEKGNYILHIQTPNGEKQNLKLIKN